LADPGDKTTTNPYDVLVVDDHAVMRTLIALMLDKFGITPRLAGSAADARSEVTARCPDLVLLDLNLPDTTGCDLAQELKCMAGMNRVPVVAVTGTGRPAQLPAGLDDWLQKPFSVRELHRVISDLLDRDQQAAG
jgi:DNA-binding response OmpR family regulator